MKKFTPIIYIFLSVCLWVFASCQRNIIPKPEKFIPEEQMEQILYDLSLLNAAKSINYDLAAKNDISVQSFIYERYAIDSLQFAENMVYYGSTPKIFGRMMSNIEKKLKAKHDSLSGREREELQQEKKEVEAKELPVKAIEELIK
ncbi:MAG: DUF4296 domain-containing protein [Capnocytophaga sp.]|nr:DUF4296 domain-containing protein [Capnocytophaga sp.]